MTSGYRSAEAFRHLLRQDEEKEGNHAQDEDQEWRRQALQGPRRRHPIKRGQAGKRHILTKKTTKIKRQLRGTTGVHKTNADSVKAMLPYA